MECKVGFQEKKKVPREYQRLSYEAAKRGNTIINLDTGLGKTLIACLLIENELSNLSPINSLNKLIIFLAPQVPLVEQQSRVIAHEVPSAIVRKLHGQMHLCHREWSAEEWKLYLTKGGNVFVMTPSIFNNMLIHGHIHINHISLIIFDECHHINGRDEYRLIMQYHYRRYPIKERPKIFGMSAPLIKGTSSIHQIPQKVNQLSSILNCGVFKPKSMDINKYTVQPEIEYITYSSYIIDPSRFEYIWPSDPGLNEERWEREQDHFYRVLDELGERAAVIALDIFIKTDEKNIYLHRFPMEKIVHDQLLRKEFQIDFDYQTKKKLLKKNWYYFKKKYIQQFNDENILQNDKLKIYDNDLRLNKPLILQSLFNNDKQNDIKQEENDMSSSEKPKYQSKRSRNNEKKKVIQKKMSSKRRNREKLEEWIETLNNQRAIESELRYFSLSPKCKVLFNVLLNEIDRVGISSFKTLILVQRRKVAQILSILINQSPLPIVSDFLISSISKGGAMNAKICPSQQKERLSRFYITDELNEDKIDVLVATSLLEEGLDVPSCKLVIKFNETISSKQDIQCKGRARHCNSRYIHLIHEKDELRQTEKLKNYKKFQKKVYETNDDNLFDPNNPNNEYVLNPKKYRRGIYNELTEAFLFEKNALLKLHEIYNRFDFELNCDVPWESFAESPFSKQNFEQSVYSGICGIWKLNKSNIQFIKIINNNNNNKYRLTIKRIRGSDEMMEGTFYITNNQYEEEYKLYRKQRRQNDIERKKKKNKKNKNKKRAQSPPLPNKFGEIHIKYQTVNKIEINFIQNNDDNDDDDNKYVFIGKISENRNNITIIDDKENNVMMLSKLENITTLNQDPNAYACNYKLILKLRDIPQSFVNNMTQRESAKQWVNNKLNIEFVANTLSIKQECIQTEIKIITDTAISFMLCLWRKEKEKDKDKEKETELINTTEMVNKLKNQINGDKCDWNMLDKEFVNNLLSQLKDIFGDDSKIFINKTNCKFLHITTYKLPHYIRDRKQENDIPVWVKQMLKKLKLNDKNNKNDKYEYNMTTFEEYFPPKRSIRIDFDISGIRIEKTEFEDRLDLLRQEFTKYFGEIHLYLPGQSNWKKSDYKKNNLYKYDKLYQQKVILPKLSAFYNHLRETTIIGDIRFNFKSARDSVAFKAIEFLYINNVLDDNFRVIGRQKAPKPMSMMATNCGVMETIFVNMKPNAFRVWGDTNYVDQLHSISFINNDNNQILYQWGLLLSTSIIKPIEFCLYPQDLHWINIESISSSNCKSKKWKVKIEHIDEIDCTSDFNQYRLSYHTNLMSLLGYNDSSNYNCNDKNCVIVPLLNDNHNHNHSIDLKRIHQIVDNPWSQFVNVDIMILWGNKLTISMIKDKKNNIIQLLSSNNEHLGHSKCRIESIEEIDEIPCITSETAIKWNVNEETTIIMIKFVTTINQQSENQHDLIVPRDPKKTSIWNDNKENKEKKEEKDEKKTSSEIYKMCKAERLQRSGFHIRLNHKQLQIALKYPEDDLRFMISHRDEAMIQSQEWPKLNEFIANNNNDNNDNANISELVVKMSSTNCYYTDLSSTNLCLSSQIGAGFSYLDVVKTKYDDNDNNKMDENELLYSASPLPLRPEDATIGHNIKLKKVNNTQSGLLIAPQICHIVPVCKKELFFSRYLCCSLWKLEKLLLINDFKTILEQYIDIEFNLSLLYQCLSLPSIDMILHSHIGRIYFFGDQLIKYCASIEAYATRREFNEVELTRFVHHTVSNDNLCDRAKSNGYLKYLITQQFDAKNYEITNFSTFDDNDDYHRISRKSIADIIEGIVTATYYNNLISNSLELSTAIIDEPFGKLDLSKMKIVDNFAMCSCREFICHLLQFSFYQQPEYPAFNQEITISTTLIKYVWNNKTVFTMDHELKEIINCLNQIKQSMINNIDDDDEQYEINNIMDEKKEEKEQKEEKKEKEFKWTSEIIDMLSVLGLSRMSSSRQIEDVIFQIHDNCMAKQWDMDNLKCLSILNKVREEIIKNEKFEIKNIKKCKKKIFNSSIFEYDINIENGHALNPIIELPENAENDQIKNEIENEIETIIKKPIKPKKIMIPKCVDDKLGFKLYGDIINFYNKHCIFSKNDATAYLLNFAIYKCISHIFVCQYDDYDLYNLTLYYRNNFTLNDIDEVINRFTILCDNEFPIFALRNSDRIYGIEEIMNYKFNFPDLVYAATTHSAFNTNNKSFCNYQRLEFIGDASIGVCVSQYLFQTFIKFEQGRLSHTRAALVCNHYLSRKLMRRFKKYNLNIKQFITIISKKDRNDIAEYIDNFNFNVDDFTFCLDLLTISKIKQPFCAKILADIYEALIGAILIDTNGNLEIIWNIIKNDFILNDKQIDCVNIKYAESQRLQDQISKLLK